MWKKSVLVVAVGLTVCVYSLIQNHFLRVWSNKVAGLPDSFLSHSSHSPVCSRAHGYCCYCMQLKGCRKVSAQFLVTLEEHKSVWSGSDRSVKSEVDRQLSMEAELSWHGAQSSSRICKSKWHDADSKGTCGKVSHGVLRVWSVC